MNTSTSLGQRASGPTSRRSAPAPRRRLARVRPCAADAHGDYKVGTGTTWRLGKEMLGATVPMRFHAGEPFPAGVARQMMEVGLKGMSAVLAG